MIKGWTEGQRPPGQGWLPRWAALLLLACAGMVAAAGAAAECARITNWSNQDAAFFPVPRVTRIDRSNTPGAFYFPLDGTQEKALLVTYFSMVAAPVYTRDRLFTNSVAVNISSFASAADAGTMFRREVASFHAINPVRWNFQLLITDQNVLAYYGDEPGNKEINYIAVHKNSIIHIRLLSSSTTEDVQGTGALQLGERAVRARDLVDAKCGDRPENHAPVIYLDTESILSQQAGVMTQMAGGRITVGAADADGAADLDWSTFRLFVAGVDKTGHALQVVTALANAGRVNYVSPVSDRNAVAYELQVDPNKLMGEHNFFNIAWNGEWPVRLRICDRQGACGQQDYTLYFGPFLIVQNFYDGRCSSVGPQEISFYATWGNNGYAATANFYLALGRSSGHWSTWTTDYWTLSMGLMPPFSQLLWFDASYGVKPVFGAAPVSLPTGAFQKLVPLTVPTEALRHGSAPVDLGSGTHSMVYGAIDLSQGVHWIETAGVALCQKAAQRR